MDGTRCSADGSCVAKQQQQQQEAERQWASVVSRSRGPVSRSMVAEPMVPQKTGSAHAVCCMGCSGSWPGKGWGQGTQDCP